MYINVGMANRENDPNKNGMTCFIHIAIPTSLYLFLYCVLKCVFMQVHACILYTGGLCCGCWKQVSARLQSSESLCWTMCVVELLGGHVT